jgi:hypothetical protein
VSAIASWVGSGIALVTAGVCWLLLRHLHHLPSNTHPWLHRLAIVGMYCAGIVFTVTAAGQWILGECRRALGLVGASTAPHSGLGWVLVTTGALALIAALLVALIWVPNERYAWIALGAGLVLALTSGGIVHQVYAASAAPALSLTSSIATWAGG